MHHAAFQLTRDIYKYHSVNWAELLIPGSCDALYSSLHIAHSLSERDELHRGPRLRRRRLFSQSERMRNSRRCGRRGESVWAAARERQRKSIFRVSYCFSTCDDFQKVNPTATNIETFCSAWQRKRILPACQLISTVYSQVINTTVAERVRLFLTDSGAKWLHI